MPADDRSSFTAQNKIYDGYTTATFDTYALTLVGVKTGDAVTLLQPNVVINFANKNVGTGKTVSITSATLSGADAGRYELSLTGAPTDTACIWPKPLTAAVVGNPTKPYDGNANATLTSSNYSLTGLVTGEDITVTKTTGTYALKDAGIRLVTVTLASGDFTPVGSTLLTNYTLPTIATGNGTITAIPLAITADNKTKVYDGAVFPYVNYTASYVGFIPGEGPLNLGGSLVFTGSAIGATTVGNWDITPGGKTSTNYNITFYNGQLTITPVTLGLKVMLQGPYYSPTGLMKTDLNTAGKIPSGQPYNVAPWNYTSGETASPPSTAVDWVLVELRTTGAGPVAGRCAALLNSDGTVSISINNVTFPGIHSGSAYFIVIWHRNHIPVMSASAITVPVTSYDFTVLGNLYGYANPVPGVPAINLGGGVYGMIAGDVTKNSALRYSGPGNDRGPIITAITAAPGGTGVGLSKTVTGGYWFEDTNLDNVLSYLPAPNDRGIITSNLVVLTGTPYLNNTYTSVVPGAYTGGKDGSNNGPVDIQFTESVESLTIDLMTNEMIVNGMVDNIQFTLAWKVGDTEIEELISTSASSFQLLPQGSPVELEGNNYQVFASVTPTYLPEVWDIGEPLTALSFEKEYGQLISSRLWIADNDFTVNNNGEYYVSNWGTDVTGMILNATVGINNPRIREHCQDIS